MMNRYYYCFCIGIIIGSIAIQATDPDEKIPNKGPIPLKPLFTPCVTPAQTTGAASATPLNYEVTQPKPVLIGLPAPSVSQSWLFASALEHAPSLVKGLCYYWKHHLQSHRIASYNKLILVGKPGTGKTTMARAIGWHLGLPVYFVSAARLFGQYRHQTAVKIRTTFDQFVDAKKPAIILIDEIHKLFEHHNKEHSDDSQTAAAFWLTLDEIEQRAPYLIVIGTANSVDSLPPELKSRFQGKIVTIPLPNKQHRIDAFYEILRHDPAIVIGNTINRAYVTRLLNTLSDQALRDIQLLIDTAKMCKYAEHPTEMPLVLERIHFDRALAQLRQESLQTHESLLVTWMPTLHHISVILGITVHLGTLTRMVQNGCHALLNMVT